jgi:hypothetical protein
MSLKSFHIFFIVASMLLGVSFGAWGIKDYGLSGSGIHLALGVGSFAASILLGWYGVWFLRKLKHVSFL